MSKIIAFAGRKGSGKDTCVNSILGMYLSALHIVQGTASVMDDGKLHVTDIWGDSEHNGIFDVNKRTESLVNLLDEYVHPYIKVYSFADPLKSICMQVLGLSYEQCYGKDEDKNTETDLQWQNMPGVITPVLASMLDKGQPTITNEHLKKEYGIDVHQTGYMTAREVLQYVGSNLFRKMSNDVWVDTTLRKIEKDNPMVAIVSDVRFPNEVEGIQQNGGSVIRLTRAPHPDTHISETALDDYEGFDYVLDNKDMSIYEQTMELEKILAKCECIPKLENL